jgi:hypothetical protein
MLSSVDSRMNRKFLLVGVVLVALAVGVASRRRFRQLKPLKAAESAILTDAKAAAPVEGEARAPSTAWLKDAASEPADPIAKVAAQRLAQAPAPGGALSDPDELAAVCVQAAVACGFELRGDVWKRPEARVNFAGVTAADALAAFAGKDYRLAWIGPVAHVFPAAAGEPRPLDTPLAADVSMNSLSRQPAETIHDIAVKLGLSMPAPRKRALRTDLVGASTMPVRNSARYILDYLTRPAILHPHTYIVVGAAQAGSLHWYWGEPPPW